MTENKIVANNGSSIVLYTTDDGNTQLEVKLEKDTVWLTQNQMAELFGRDRTVITAQVRKSVDSPPDMLTEDHHHTVHEERQVCYSSHLRPKPLHL